MDDPFNIKLYALTLDCLDPYALAEFYAALLGWEIPFHDDEYAVIAPPGIAQGAYPGIAFQQNADYTPPVWPEQPSAQQQMAHLDLAVDDLEAAVGHALRCGGVLADTQFSDDWRVLLDPSGHPFCLCLMKHIFTAGE